MGGKRSFLKSWFLFVLTLCLTLGVSGPLFAQDDADEFTLEEVVVTAEKREAELQKIPIDIAVVRPDDMERLNIHQVEDLDKMMPDMTIDNFASGMLAISIRDVETTFWNPTTETTVAVHIDGQQLTRSTGLEGKLYDLERIETLKGPQGTLYGRGSTAGTMNMVTKRPDIGNFGGNISMEYGSYDRRRVQGALNIPLTDRMALRLSGRTITRDGYDDANLGNQDMWGMRGSLRWEPDDTQQLVITVDKDRTDNRGGYANGILFDTYGNLSIVRNPALDIPEGDPGYIPEPIRKYMEGGPVYAPFAIKDIIGEASNDQYVRNKSWGINATYDKEFDFAWLTVQGGYRAMREFKSWVLNPSLGLQPVGATLMSMYFPFDTYDPETGVTTPATYFDPNFNFIAYSSVPYGTATPYPGLALFNIWNTDNLSAANSGEFYTELMVVPPTFRAAVATQDWTNSRMYSGEARLASKAAVNEGDAYEWLIGAMYMNDYVYEQARVYENVDNQVILREYAVFGQASYVPIANINITGGYRYTWDTKSFWGSPESLSAPADPSDFWVRYPITLDPDTFINTWAKYTNQTYKANISWQVTDDIMPYIQYSKGIKTANVNRNGQYIDPESLDSYEIGIRSRLFNGRLQFNATAYHYDYNNYNEWHTVYGCVWGQDPNNPGSCLNAEGNDSPINPELDYTGNDYTPLNVGKAEQEGANMDATWLITPRDILRVNGSWSVNRRVDFNVAEAMRAYGEANGFVADSADNPAYADDSRNGQRFGGRAVKGWIGYTRTQNIGTDLLQFNTTGFYTGRGRDQIIRRGRDDEYLGPPSPDYWLFDVSVTYTSSKWMPEGSQWNVRLYANNVFDKDLWGSRSRSESATNYPVGTGTINGSFLTPRTIGVVLGFNF